MTWFLTLMCINMAIWSGQPPQPSELVLEKTLEEEYVSTFACVEGTSYWASSGYYGVTLWEGFKKKATVESYWNPPAMQFGKDEQTMNLGSVKVDFSTESLTRLPQLWDDSYRATLNSMVFCEDGKHIVVYAVVRPMKTLDRTPDPYIGEKILVINTETGKSTHTLEESEIFLPNKIAMAIQGDMVVAVTDGLEAWNWQTGESLFKEDKSLPYLSAVEIDPLSKAVFAGTNEGILECWDTESWTQQTTFKTGLERITHLKFHPTQSLLAVTGEKGELLLYRVQGAQIERVAALDLETEITSLGWGGKGEKLYVSTREQILIYALK